MLTLLNLIIELVEVDQNSHTSGRLFTKKTTEKDGYSDTKKNSEQPSFRPSPPESAPDQHLVWRIRIRIHQRTQHADGCSEKEWVRNIIVLADCDQQDIGQCSAAIVCIMVFINYFIHNYWLSAGNVIIIISIIKMCRIRLIGQCIIAKVTTFEVMQKMVILGL